ncbi:TonB-dependent receptor [Mucilaginibacter sabulilitoris]|uniref:TonB-dependent receptor n=1 Tax=Mucilaginibacter sabulilitoris TaxID=1173583 RepID=A0ABZ0TJV2_9SPHI|nr:TonB-dependent receptor [Mucilaginibacter sabulilitoris]WPU91465.1 TonB-dependent receptor [Mucilaginibacter sabulilitoris]
MTTYSKFLLKKKNSLIGVLLGLIVLAPVKVKAVTEVYNSPKRTFSEKPVRMAISIAGTVVDEKGETLPGASVKVKSSGKGVVTDTYGKFTVDVANENDAITVTFVGYKAKTVIVGNSKTLTIKLEPDLEGQKLNEVVVVGFGTQKKVNLTGAVTQISGKELQDRPAANVGQALQGKVANLNITTTGDPGGPGTNSSFNIRGTTSLSATGPLYVVDGIPVDNINDLNAQDIETISVLKDAASSAIYGARAPYGVILVTTKRGKKGEKTAVSLNSIVGQSSYTSLPKMANSLQFAEAYNAASVNSGQGTVFSDDIINKIRDNINKPGTWPVSTPDPANPNKYTYASPLNTDNVDWFREYFKPWSFNQKHDINVSGGSENTTYYIGAGYYDQGGQLRYANEDFSRYNVTGNIRTEPTKWLRVGLITRFSKRNTNLPYPYASQLGNWVHMASTRWPNWALRNPDGQFSTASNVEFLNSGGRSKNNENDLSITGSLEAEPIKDWKINLDYAYNNTASRYQDHSAYVYSWNVDGTKYNIGPSVNSVSEGMISDNYNTVNLYSSYLKNFDKHHFKILAGTQVEVYKGYNVSGSRSDLITDDLPSISTATGTQYAYDILSQWATIGTFGRFNYDYDEKYLIEFNGRYDGTSRFREGSRFGFFPSVSAGYNLARENYWEGLKNTINEFKLRASYGSLGNQNVANYQYLATIPIGTNIGYILNGERPSYLNSPGLISPDLTWETSRTLDFGLDASFLKSRLNLTFDVYTRTTLNMLGPASVLPAALGAAVPYQNNADLKTKGFELGLTWRDQIGSDFNYNVSVVLSDYKSRIVKYYNPTNLLSNYFPGNQIGDIWGFQTAGLIKTDNDLASMPDQSYLFGRWTKGDVLYTDLNGDNKINIGNNTLANHGDLKVIGNSTPRYSYGINLGASWKGIDFSMFLQGVAKRDLWLGGGSAGNNSGNLFWGFTPNFGNNVYQTTLDYYSESNPNAYWPTPYVSSEGAKNHQIQTRYLQSGAYMRLKNLQVGYDLSRLLKHSGLRKIRIYFTGENLLTFSGINKNFDPEVVSGGWGTGKIYPLLKTYSLGTNINF